MTGYNVNVSVCVSLTVSVSSLALTLADYAYTNDKATAFFTITLFLTGLCLNLDICLV